MERVLHIANGKIFQEKSLVLKEVNFDLSKGQFVYLIGKTGTGKSSLLKTLYGELNLESGEGEIAGFDLTNLKRKQIPLLRRKLGIVFQDFQLLTDRTVYKNLFFVMRSTGWKKKELIKKRADEVLQLVGLENKGYKMPHELSGGEQQRVVIARALLNNPEIILADEPTGNLDPETSKEITKLLLEIADKGTSVIMATHDLVLMETFPAPTLKCENETVVTLNPVNEFDPFKAFDPSGSDGASADSEN